MEEISKRARSRVDKILAGKEWIFKLMEDGLHVRQKRHRKRSFIATFEDIVDLVHGQGHFLFTQPKQVEYLTIREAADRLSATTSTVRRWIADGEIKAQKIGGHWRIKNTDLPS